MEAVALRVSGNGSRRDRLRVDRRVVEADLQVGLEEYMKRYLVIPFFALAVLGERPRTRASFVRGHVPREGQRDD